MLYERFKDEAQFREAFIKPLLNRLGFYGVADQDGPQEFGKDFVFSELHRLGGMRHYAAQVKHEKTIRHGSRIDELLSQIKQAFATPFTRTDSPRPCYVSAVYVFNSGGITPIAKEYLLSALVREPIGDNVHFLDGERLDALNEWGTLQSDASARARLVGLRSALRHVIADLDRTRIKGQATLTPVFVHGIELFLAEPVNTDDRLLVSLFKLWTLLQGMEELRKMFVLTSKLANEQLPRIASLAADARPLAIEACNAVDTVLEKMRPLR
jgi:hypothetical protein